MLPARHRLGGGRDFGQVVGRGSRARRGALVVHFAAPAVAVGADRDTSVAKAGFVVSRAVGGSVTRHAVVRRLRAVTLPRLAELPAGSRLVVRALPAAATSTSVQLAADLDAALAAARSRGRA